MDHVSNMCVYSFVAIYFQVVCEILASIQSIHYLSILEILKIKD